MHQTLCILVYTGSHQFPRILRVQTCWGFYNVCLWRTSHAGIDEDCGTRYSSSQASSSGGDEGADIEIGTVSIDLCLQGWAPTLPWLSPLLVTPSMQVDEMNTSLVESLASASHQLYTLLEDLLEGPYADMVQVSRQYRL